MVLSARAVAFIAVGVFIVTDFVEFFSVWAPKLRILPGLVQEEATPTLVMPLKKLVSEWIPFFWMIIWLMAVHIKNRDSGLLKKHQKCESEKARMRFGFLIILEWINW